jgi:hypothetical protein
MNCDNTIREDGKGGQSLTKKDTRLPIAKDILIKLMNA